MSAEEWIGYLEHATPELLGVYTANAGKGGHTIFAQMVYERCGARLWGLPWCATFVHAAVGRPDLLGRPHAGTRVLARRMRRKGLWRDADYIPRRGDLIFCSVRGRVGHVGIVERAEGDTVVSIEGNTVDPSGTFPPDEGGAVARRERDIHDPIIAGYGAIGELLDKQTEETFMEDNITLIKACAAGLVAAGTALWGWFGWLVVVWAACMVLDYASGTLAAMKQGEWSSAKAREGLWHKGGMILTVAVAALADVAISLIIGAGVVQLPFTYSVLLTVVVVAWYTLTELGSILENAVRMGSNVPKWLTRFLKISAEAVEQTGEQVAGGTGDDKRGEGT